MVHYKWTSERFYTFEIIGQGLLSIRAILDNIALDLPSFLPNIIEIGQELFEIWHFENFFWMTFTLYQGDSCQYRT